MRFISSLLLSAAALISSADFASAELRLPAIFSDGMVLQQKSLVQVWGWATPGEEVTVKGGWLGSWVAGTTAVAGDDGKWSLEIHTPEAGGPMTLNIWGEGVEVTLKDVLIGEVWLCSGQSNMQWELEKIIEHAREQTKLPKDTLDVKRPNIRFFDVARATAQTPLDDCTGKWGQAVGDEANRCSAVGYFFACELQDALGVPVGLLDSNWGGTRAEAWTSDDTIRTFRRHATDLDLALAPSDTAVRDVETAYWERVREVVPEASGDQSWLKQELPGLIEGGPIGDFDGSFTYRKTIFLPKTWLGKEVHLDMPAIDDLDVTLWNGTVIGSTVERQGWSKPRRYVVPAELVVNLKVVIEIHGVDTGGAGGMARGEDFQLRSGPEALGLRSEWEVRRGAAAAELPRPPYQQAFNHQSPTSLFNGMIAPLVPYGIRGVTWYQGESNRKDPANYRLVFPSLIVDWRQKWDAPELPFYFVQLAPHDYDRDGQPDLNVAETRDAQAAALSLPATGMALTADIGWPQNIHPLNKWEVGRRLALFALRDLHGRSDIEPNGPTFGAAIEEGSSLRLEFDHLAGELTAPAALEHFEIAGADGSFVPASAVLSDDKKSIVVSADGVTSPKRARYLWSDAAEATVFGGTGLPMAPFQSK